MNNPERILACSRVDPPTLDKTDNIETSPFIDTKTKLCYYEKKLFKKGKNFIKEMRLSTALKAIELVRIPKSSENEETEMVDSMVIGENYEEKVLVTDVPNMEDSTRVSDSESCSSGENSCLTVFEPCLKRKLTTDYLVKIPTPDPETEEDNKDDDDDDDDDNEEIKSKKFKLESHNEAENNILKEQKYSMQLNETPSGMKSWLEQFQEWSHAERVVVLNQLLEICEHTQVVHLMEIVEPRLQRDFIFLLPKELALYVLSFLEPRALLQAAQTSRYWKCLSEDDLLWREKCVKAGFSVDPLALVQKRKNRVPNSSASLWKSTYLRSYTIDYNWRTSPVKAPKVLKGHDDHVITCLQFCGNKIVSGSDDNTMKVWSATTGKCLRTLVGHNGGVWSSQMFGDIIISGSTDRTLRVWNADTGECIHILSGHTSTVRCMHLHGKIVVSGSRDATLRMWDIDSGVCIHILVGHTAAVRCVQYDGRYVVSGGYDYFVKVWDPNRELCLHTLTSHGNRVYSLQFDGVHIVSGSLDTSIRVWDVETGVEKHILMGHQSLTSGMELQNNILVSGNADSTVKVWDIITGRCLQTLAGKHRHESAVTCLQFNSKFVITSSDDGTVKLWDLKSGEFIRNLVKLESGGSGGVVWRIRASETKLVCAVGSRNGTEETKLLVLDFDVDAK